jgi:hypothetical protein
MPRFNVNIPPSAGYRFQEDDGTVIVGKSWSAVIARLKSYRNRNKKKTGNAEREVYAQACKQSPETCSGDSSEQRFARQVVSVKGRVLAWFARMRQKRDSQGISFVGDDERNQRVQICAGCPNNTQYPGGCSSCKKVVTEFRKDLVGGRAIDSRLAGCAVLGEDVAASVWLEEVREENNDLPAHCWRKRTL